MNLYSFPTSFLYIDTALTEFYTLSYTTLFRSSRFRILSGACGLRLALHGCRFLGHNFGNARQRRSEEHTSELQSRRDLVCRLLLELINLCHISFYHLYAHDRAIAQRVVLSYC